MPPLRLATILSTALPPLPREARAVVDLLACTNGLLPPGGEVLTSLGLRPRHQVARVLRRAGLPPLEELAGWTRVLHWLHEAERTGNSLLQLARESRLEPATCYRLVRRLTGQPWSRVRRGGVAGGAAPPLPTPHRSARKRRRQTPKTHQPQNPSSRLLFSEKKK